MKLPLPVRIIFGTTISQAAPESWWAGGSIVSGDATTGTNASVGEGVSRGRQGPLAGTRSKWANNVTQVTAKWKSLGSSAVCVGWIDPGSSTAVSGSTELAFGFPMTA
ncbi:MAG: hypothetical protein ACLPWF_10685 [Bryobacteraceae bacterium]